MKKTLTLLLSYALLPLLVLYERKWLLRANAQAICTSFKKEMLCGLHALGDPPIRAAAVPDDFKVALYLASGSLGEATTEYAVTDEVSGAGYTAGGIAITNTLPPDQAGTTGFWTPGAAFEFVGVTLATPFDAALVYNDSQGGKAVGVYTFGAQSITAGTFRLAMPTNDEVNALLRFN